MTTQSWAGARVHLTKADPGTSALWGNVGLHVGDAQHLVRARRRALAAELGRDIVWMHQTHSTRVDVVVSLGGKPSREADGIALDQVAPGEWGPLDADGVVLNARGWEQALAVAVQTADCLPVVMSADHGRVVAAVHAGRRGLLGGILACAVGEIRARVDGPIDAMIGPAICGRCYEVPPEMAERSNAVMPGICARTSWGTPSLDLPGAAARSLADLGVRVVVDGRCTLEDPRLFSYRAEPACGRQALIIVPA